MTMSIPILIYMSGICIILPYIYIHLIFSKNICVNIQCRGYTFIYGWQRSGDVIDLEVNFLVPFFSICKMYEHGDSSWSPVPFSINYAY